MNKHGFEYHNIAYALEQAHGFAVLCFVAVILWIFGLDSHHSFTRIFQLASFTRNQSYN